MARSRRRGGDPQQTIKDQMLFTIGQLNGKTGVGRLDKLAITNVRSERQGDAHARPLPREAPRLDREERTLSRSYTLILPKRADYAGQEAFFTKYSATTCTDSYAHDNETGIYWYYYRPEQAGCTLAADDVVKAKATVRVSPENTQEHVPRVRQGLGGQRPQRRLDLRQVRGRRHDGRRHRRLEPRSLREHDAPRAAERGRHAPRTRPTARASPTRTSRIESTLPNGKKVKLTSFLVDNVREGGAAFERRYNELSGDADVIVYNGHAGLGQNVRALAHMGTFKPGQVPDRLHERLRHVRLRRRHARRDARALEPDDPTGTKFMEILTNSMPPNWESLPNNTMSLIRDLSKTEAPVKYTDILSHFDQSGFVTVTGDEDNTFKP